MKRIDENEFFRQATLRICGTLDIGKAMIDSVLYIKDFIPISEMVLSKYDPNTSVIRNLATVDFSGRLKPFPVIHIPDELIPLAGEEFKLQTVKVEDNPEQHPVGKFIIPHHDTPNPSAMYMVLVMEGTELGLVGVLATGKGVYTKNHARLFSLLREPFSIAASNAQRYEEVLKLKEMVDAENRELNRELLRSVGDEIVGAEFGLAGVMEMVRQVAPLSSPVMLLGETGVGKEVIANAIHRMSPRSGEPFIKVNCGAIPEGLVDAELFGHEKGAFTGAITQRRGRFERAHKGSIFLDEIADLPLQAQVKLLRVLQQKEIERVGGTQMIPVDVRIMTATNKNLEEMVRLGTFREDLWYRLNIFPITIPPLRQRTEDIPVLVRYLVEKKAKELKIHTPPPVSARGVEMLKTYYWPGNVRELENFIERELIRKRGSENVELLSPRDLDPYININIRKGQITDSYESIEKIPSLEEATSQLIRRALRMTKGKVFGEDGAAILLGLKPDTLRSKMRKLGISVQREVVKK